MPLWITIGKYYRGIYTVYTDIDLTIIPFSSPLSGHILKFLNWPSPAESFSLSGAACSLQMEVLVANVKRNSCSKAVSFWYLATDVVYGVVQRLAVDVCSSDFFVGTCFSHVPAVGWAVVGRSPFARSPILINNLYSVTSGLRRGSRLNFGISASVINHDALNEALCEP